MKREDQVLTPLDVHAVPVEVEVAAALMTQGREGEGIGALCRLSGAVRGRAWLRYPGADWCCVAASDGRTDAPDDRDFGATTPDPDGRRRLWSFIGGSGRLVLDFPEPVPAGVLPVGMEALFSAWFARAMERGTAVLEEKRFADTLDSIDEGYFELDLAGNLTWCNPACFRLADSHPAEVLGLNNRSYASPETARTMFQVFNTIYRTGKPALIRDYEVILLNGQKRTFEVSASVRRNATGKRVGFRGLVRDITDKVRAETERRRLAEQIQQSRRMEAIGTLAGGIAHDFNNLLMGIQGNVSLMMLKGPEENPHYDNAKSIERCVESGASLTRQLLGFARGGKYREVPLDLNRLIKGTISMFTRTRSRIRVESDLADGVMTVLADPGQLEQVMLNLYSNAWQAMPDGGVLSIGTDTTEVDGVLAEKEGVAVGPYVQIRIADTGIGMDEATISRIFEPFFTTREMGRGTGLGLASTFGIIKGHGGFLSVESEPGKGSTFLVHLPAAGPVLSPSTSFADLLFSGTETLLLVDDESVILEVTSEMLQGLGYGVKSAGNGTEALKRVETHPEIDLVILDMGMPDIGGEDLCRRIWELRPTLPVLISSGYNRNPDVDRLISLGCKGFIQKPYTLELLSRTLRRVLSAEVADRG